MCRATRYTHCARRDRPRYPVLVRACLPIPHTAAFTHRNRQPVGGGGRSCSFQISLYSRRWKWRASPSSLPPATLTSMFHSAAGGHHRRLMIAPPGNAPAARGRRVRSPRSMSRPRRRTPPPAAPCPPLADQLSTVSSRRLQGRVGRGHLRCVGSPRQRPRALSTIDGHQMWPHLSAGTGTRESGRHHPATMDLIRSPWVRAAAAHPDRQQHARPSSSQGSKPGTRSSLHASRGRHPPDFRPSANTGHVRGVRPRERILARCGWRAVCTKCFAHSPPAALLLSHFVNNGYTTQPT